MREESSLVPAIREAYDVDASRWRLVSYHSRIDRAATLRTAALAIKDVDAGTNPDAVLSRNLYAAFILAVLKRRPLIFETHQLEHGFRLLMQRAIITRPWVNTVTISQALAGYLATHCGLPATRAHVLPDAARRGMNRIAPKQRRDAIRELVPEARRDWLATCSYFGHLYPGRGIEIIEEMADARPSVAFLVFGGNESDLESRRGSNRRPNLFFLGHRPHAFALKAMAASEVLLMPYQARVSIGAGKHDTAQWMSPMKMFEYLASGVPVIASDLPVLREVLQHERNALLVQPERSDLWVAALDRLVADADLADRLGSAGHSDYLTRYTWDKRADELLAIAARMWKARPAKPAA
jgi:glycosyltransferase involved in cell wall biosynthesis